MNVLSKGRELETDRQSYRDTQKDRLIQLEFNPHYFYLLAGLLLQTSLARPGDVWGMLPVCQKESYSDSHSVPGYSRGYRKMNEKEN